MAVSGLNYWSNRNEWNRGMDVYISTVAGQPARPRTDAHADGSTFVSRKATNKWFTAYQTRTLFADALEIVRAISFMTYRNFI